MASLGSVCYGDNEVPMSGSSKASSFYIVQFVHTSPSSGTTTTKGWAQEDGIKCDFGSQYGSFSSGPMLSAISGAAGVGVWNQWLTAKYWKGVNHPKLSVNFRFVSHNDACEDILKPLNNLIKMTLPKQISAGAIEIPGPTLLSQAAAAGGSGLVAGAISTISGAVNSLSSGGSIFDMASGGADITFSFGEFITIRPIVVENVSMDAKPMFDENGNPISVGCTVQFSPFFAPFTGDLEGKSDKSIFRIGGPIISL